LSSIDALFLTNLCSIIRRCAALVMVFMTKFRATFQFISKTPLTLFTYEDLHELHVFSGWTILVNGMTHAAFHIARWISQNNVALLWKHFSGISGLIVTVAMCLICFPMLIYKHKVRYEIRKGLHYFFILFCLAMCFHAPTSAFPNGGFSTWGFTILILWWILDYSYCLCYMTEKIDSTIFHVVPTGVQLTMRVSNRFQKTGVRGGYCYVNFPWLSRYEWHAFSLFENPSNPDERQIFMEKFGDWTSKLHKTLQRDTTRPIWVQGPFSSPYNSADEYDHQILVAGGIGITPALSVMRAHKTTRRTNLIWAVRDPHMLEFFLRRAEFSERGWNLIFYTGKEKTYVDDQSDIITSTGARVHIIKSRPDFDRLIPNLIYSIESKKSVPEAYIPNAKIEAVQFLKERLVELDQEAFLDNRDKIRVLVEDAESFGFMFTDLVAEFFGEELSHTFQQSLRAQENSYLMEKESSNSGVAHDTSTREMKPLIGKSSRGLGEKSSSVRTFASGEQILSGLRNIDRGQSVRFFSESPGSLISHRNASMRSLVRGLSVRNVSSRHMANYERIIQRQDSMTTRAWKAVTMAADDWAKEHVPTFKPWEEDPTESKAYVNQMDPEIKKSWGMLYCGGKSPLADNANKAASDFGLDMHMESFAW
jgi:predicted ferric reductase